MTSSRLGKRDTCMRPVGVPLVHLLRKDAWVSSHVERFGCNHTRCLMVTVVLSRNIGGHPRENVCRKLVIFPIVHQNCSLALLTEVGAQCERAVVVQLLVTSPPHGIAPSFYLNLSSEFQSFPIFDVGKHELCLPNLAR
jgi:hypothetical protein